MDISAFRDIGQVSNAHVLLNVGTNELKVRRQTFLNRAVDWIRGKISPDPMATTARDVAHNRFLSAIASSAAYDDGDVSRAEALLSVDVLAGRPLSSRRVREVIDDLDGRSTQAERDNRVTVAWMSTRGIDQRLQEKDAAGSLTPDERALVGARVSEAIHGAGNHGTRRVDHSAAAAATDRAVDGFLAEKTARAEAEQRARAEAAERARAQALAPPSTAPRQQATPGLAPTPPAGATAAATSAEHATVGESAAAASTASPREARADRKVLLRALAKAKLPAKLRPELRALIKRGEVTNEAGLARRANASTATWVLENRVGRWYGEALRNAGARGKIRNGEELMASTRMLDKVRQSIANSPEILAYADVKKQARAVIAEHVAREAGARV